MPYNKKLFSTYSGIIAEAIVPITVNEVDEAFQRLIRCTDYGDMKIAITASVVQTNHYRKIKNQNCFKVTANFADSKWTGEPLDNSQIISIWEDSVAQCLLRYMNFYRIDEDVYLDYSNIANGKTIRYLLYEENKN